MFAKRLSNMKIIPLKTDKVITPGENLVQRIIETFKQYKLSPEDGDILAIALKVVSISKKAFIEKGGKPSEKAVTLSKKYKLEPSIMEEILSQKPIILGGADGVVATIYNGVIVGNMGIDRKNAHGKLATRWPRDIENEAHRLRRELRKYLNKDLGVVIVDSRVEPLRRGTRGFAVSISGFEAIRSYIGEKDLNGREIRYTVQNIADEIASIAHLYMGEGAEKTPFVYIKDPPTKQSNKASIDDLKIPLEKCIYLSGILGKRYEYSED